MAERSTRHTGGCLCGAVTYRITGSVTDVVACHCSQCRRQTGHYYAVVDVKRADVEITGVDHLTDYRASDFATRRFCKICGSALFWEGDASDEIAILAGTLDDTDGMTLTQHIFCSDKGDYYTLDDGVPQCPQNRD